MRTAQPMQRRQRGTTLLIALIFLVILTLFAVSGMNTGVINLRTANNAQLIVEAESAAQQRIEAMLNSVTPFVSGVLGTATITYSDAIGNNYPSDATCGGSTPCFRVTTQPPICLSIVPAPGYSYEFAASAPKDTVWQVTASAQDGTFGAVAAYRSTRPA
jgi:Tfp pilus assembly protein PilX